MNTRIRAAIILFLSLFGILDAWYITAVSVLGSPLYCVRTIFSCDAVLTSSYARLFFGIPNSVVGIGFYGFIFVLAALKISGLDFKFGEKLSSWDMARFLIAAGFIAHLYFIYLQFFVLYSLCLWCLVSALLTVLLFIVCWSGAKTVLGISRLVNKVG